MTHVCSRGPKRCHSNRADSRHRMVRRCGTGTWGIAQSWGHMTLDPGCRCYRCTRTAGIGLQPALGCHSNQVHTDHSGALGKKRQNMTVCQGWTWTFFVEADSFIARAKKLAALLEISKISKNNHEQARDWPRTWMWHIGHKQSRSHR